VARTLRRSPSWLPLPGRPDHPRGTVQGDQRSAGTGAGVGRLPRVRRGHESPEHRHLGSLPGLPDGPVAGDVPPALV